MGKFISVSMLKPYAPSLVNRDDTGDAKQIVVGGVTRARISSQCLKRAIRQEIGNRGITTAHLEDLIEQILIDQCEAGNISESDVDKIGKAVCCESILNCDWSKRTSQAKESKKKEDSNKGRTVNQVNMLEIDAVVNTAIKNKGMKQKDLEKEIKKSLESIRVSADKSMFGTMATSGVIESVDGAVQMAQTFSIDEYIPEDDFITAKFSTESVEDWDPFFGSYKKFESENLAKPDAETLANSCVHSNTMLSCTSVNIVELKRNLSRSIVGTDINVDDVNHDVIKAICDYIETLITVEPSAKQNAMSSHSVPAVVYIEVIDNGAVKYPQGSFESVVRRREDKSIVETGIERIADFSADDTFRNGDIVKYFMLSSPYKKYSDSFRDSGCSEVSNLKELRNILTESILSIL